MKYLPSLQKTVDVLDRTVATAVVSFVAITTATSLSDPNALKAAGVAAGLSALRYLGSVAYAYLHNEPVPLQVVGSTEAPQAPQAS